MIRLLLLASLALPACVKERPRSEAKTSDLVGHYSRTVVGGGTLILCDAYFTTEDAPSTTVQLESDAFVTCNGTILTGVSGFYSGSIVYSPGLSVAISLIRSVDGTSLTDTEMVY